MREDGGYCSYRALESIRHAEQEGVGAGCYSVCLTPTTPAYEIISSTRRFCWRPVAVSFEATGDAFP